MMDSTEFYRQEEMKAHRKCDELSAEIESLRQQLASAQEELHFQACLTRDLLPYQERAIKSEQQLAAALAACDAKDARFKQIVRMANHLDVLSIAMQAHDALATKPDASALKAHDEQVKADFLKRSGKWLTNDAMIKAHDEALIERCAETADKCYAEGFVLDAIRELKSQL